MSRDPYSGSIWDPASLHRYNYARANPVNYIDPSGRGAIVETALSTIGVVGDVAMVYQVGKQVACEYSVMASILDIIFDAPYADGEQMQLLSLQLEKSLDKCGVQATWQGNLLNISLLLASYDFGPLFGDAEEGFQIVKPIVLDTNAVIRFGEVGPLLNPGETPVITPQVLTELNNLVAQGEIDAMPNIVQQLQVVPEASDIWTQANLRSTIGQFTGPSKGPVVDLNSIQGLSGDGVIGATAISMDAPLVTADKAFAQALAKLGAEVRLIP